MRSTPKIRRVQLKLNQSDESVILGIVSAEADYKLTLAINKNLGLSLKNSSPLTINGLPGDETGFSRFSDSSSSENLVYDLTSNRSGKNCLVGKLKNIDYFLRIHDPDNEVNTDQIVAKLREMDSVTAVFNIDTGSVKDKNINHLIH
ncbi:MAG: IPExxxVDY family protein [Bacteroidota bacterium]